MPLKWTPKLIQAYKLKRLWRANFWNIKSQCATFSCNVKKATSRIFKKQLQRKRISVTHGRLYVRAQQSPQMFTFTTESHSLSFAKNFGCDKRKKRKSTKKKKIVQRCVSASWTVARFWDQVRMSMCLDKQIP